METEIEIKNNKFNELLELSKKVPVVVDFYADWCMPCKMLKPILEGLAKEYNGKFVLAKVNVDENSEVASQYDIMSIPSVKMIKNKKVVGEFMGAQPESVIKSWLDEKI
ncbi:thioredoxin [Candidatus Woesearchaeota archaeon CG10_big_fil_rev_8_21_14_0_10_34_12]|nr:MAG: thioredoxin [Candidatus Woesearchaeota archaeon CG10_big_fil_rev_8_21_14_0_10_34_12]